MGKPGQKNKDDKEKLSQASGEKEEALAPEKEESEIKEELTSKPDEKIEISVSEFEELDKKAKLCNDYHDKLMRLGAEFDNTLKRMNKEKEGLIRFATFGLIMEILPIVDDFDRLIEGIKNNQINGAVFEGIKMIQKRIHEVLAKNGLSKMNVVGEKFDPTKHEALLTVETDEYSENTIIEEVRSGYFLHERVLRPAVVKVAKKKPESG